MFGQSFPPLRDPQAILGDALYTTPPDETMDHLPSPEYFRGKILVKVSGWRLRLALL
jgi:hypothetical protein